MQKRSDACIIAAAVGEKACLRPNSEETKMA